MRHAIIGAGFGVDVHLPAFAGLTGVEVVAISDAGSGRAKQSALEGVSTYSDWRRMLDEVRPDSLSVAVPPVAQREIVIQAIQSGIHVLCEKPFGMCAEDAASMFDAAFVARIVGAVGFQYRFEPGISELRKQVFAGKVGRVRRVDFAWFTSGRASASRPWSWQHEAAKGGGVVNAFLPHVVDLMLWLANSAATSVVGRTAVLIPKRPDHNGVLREVTAEDVVDALLEFENGVVGNIRVTNCQPAGEGMRIEVHGDKGVLQFTHCPPFGCGDARLLYYRPEAAPELIALTDSAQKEPDTRSAPFQRLAQQFASAVRGKRTSELPTFHDGLKAQRVITALRQSVLRREFVDIHEHSTNSPVETGNN